MRQDRVAVDEFVPAVAAEDLGRRLRFHLWGSQLEPEGQLDPGAHPLQGDPEAGAEKAVVAHLHKARGQHMLEKAPDELQGVEPQGTQAVASGLPVAEENLIVLDLDDAAVRDRHPEDVGGEIFDRSLRAAHGLGVDVPLNLPKLGGDLGVFQ